ncbi:transposase [Desulfosarcina ovata]|uniref:transposase n=1 Tax=Desulfosarcina ovata TaxID=83564 RepID=UPI00156553FD
MDLRKSPQVLWCVAHTERRRCSIINFNKLAHAVWECKYHIVWCPKYRLRVLKSEIGKSIRNIIRQ